MVVDTGINAKGWSREQAIGWMADHTFHSHYEVQSEVRAWPARLSLVWRPRSPTWRLLPARLCAARWTA
jgi:hypothetical protein